MFELTTSGGLDSHDAIPTELFLAPNNRIADNLLPIAVTSLIIAAIEIYRSKVQWFVQPVRYVGLHIGKLKVWRNHSASVVYSPVTLWAS